MAKNSSKELVDIESDVLDEVIEPPMYRVLLLNDDYTTMEFVVLVLQQVFHKSQTEAEGIMLLVHERGAGLAGVYAREIAETKVAVVHQMARQHEFPLRCALEPEK